MSARDTIRRGLDPEHPLYPHLHGTIGLDANNHRIWEWRDKTGKIEFSTPLTGLAVALEQLIIKEGNAISPQTHELIEQFKGELSQLENPKNDEWTAHSSGSPER